MSWQAYVDTNLVGTGKIAKAAIVGQQRGVWAATPGFTISDGEQVAIVEGFNNFDDVRAKGVYFGGQKYFTVSAIDRTIRGQKGTDGVVIVKTIQAILIALYTAPYQAGEVAPIVEALADYLVGQGC